MTFWQGVQYTFMFVTFFLTMSLAYQSLADKIQFRFVSRLRIWPYIVYYLLLFVGNMFVVLELSKVHQ